MLIGLAYLFLGDVPVARFFQRFTNFLFSLRTLKVIFLDKLQKS